MRLEETPEAAGAERGKGLFPWGVPDGHLRTSTLIFDSWSFTARDQISVTVFKLFILIDK